MTRALTPLTPKIVELIPTLGALFARGGPVQDPVLTFSTFQSEEHLFPPSLKTHCSQMTLVQRVLWMSQVPLDMSQVPIDMSQMPLYVSQVPLWMSQMPL